MSLQRNDVRDKFLFNLDIYYVLSSRVNSSIKYNRKGNLYISRYISNSITITIIIQSYFYSFFFFFKLSVRQFANKKPI